MEERKLGKRYSTERQERFKSLKQPTAPDPSSASIAIPVVETKFLKDATIVESVAQTNTEMDVEEPAERATFDKYICDMDEKHKLRLAIKEKNSRISDYRPDESDFIKLDSSLKKNTALVRKLKTFSESQREALLKEIKSLNLTKYISEVAAAVIEAKLKMTDIAAAVEVCCLLHERYADFSEALLENWQKVLLQKKDDKVVNQSKFRVDLRFFADLISVGVLPDKGSLNILSQQLNILINYDKEEHNNISIIQSFCKHCAADYAGLFPRKMRLLSEKYGVAIPSCPTLPPEKQKACRNLLKDYYSSLANKLQKDHRELQYTEWQNKRILHTKGELSQEKQEKLEAMKIAYNKLFANVEEFSNMVDEEMCELINHKFGSSDGDLEFTVPQEFQYDGNTSLFEDEETQQFYEKLLDLRAILPQILIKDTATPEPQQINQPNPSNDEADLKVEDIEKELENEKEADMKQSISSQNEADEITDDMSIDDADSAETEASTDDSFEMAATTRLLFEKFLKDLETCVNRELIDRAAQDFCMSHNTKRNRKRLAKVVFSVHRTRYDLLPFYSRFVATLNPCMPDVAADLCNYLTLDFRHQVRKKDQIYIESKLKTVRFIGELVKFKIFNKNEALHCLKMLLFDFSHHNIDMACALLETCGRFLYRSPDSHHRTRVYLEVMMRKKGVLSMDSRYCTMIENAFYYCNPPSNTSVSKEVKIPKHEFIRRLLFKDLNKVNTEKILKLMRKLNWKDEQLRQVAVECLMSVWNVKYGNIHCMANLLSGIAPYHEDVAVQVIDGVLEDIRIGMEINHPKFNQRRMAMVKYLGELYNYRLVDSAVIFKTLYSFIMFGVTYDDANLSILDPPPHLFRLMLICVLLDTCGQYFDKGSSKKKLDYYLVYFQKYYWFKKNSSYWSEEVPFPINVDMVVKDTFDAIHLKGSVATSYEDACSKVEKLNEEFKEKLTGILPFKDRDDQIQELEDESDLPTIREQDESASGSQSQSQLAQEGADKSDSQPEQSQTKHASPGRDDDEDSDEHSLSETGDDEDIDDEEDGLTPPPDEDLEFEMKQKGPKLLACKEDEDFMAAFDKMLAENLQQRTSEILKVNQTDITVPVNYKTQIKKPPAPNNYSPDADDAGPTMKFALMTKKGNKPHFSTVDLDVTQQFATRYKEREMEEKAEKERLKQLVLEFNERQEVEEQAAIEAGKSLIPNTNREKKVKYQHPKGAPDADLIFGSGPKNFTKR